jgi:hypothetical protein
MQACKKLLLLARKKNMHSGQIERMHMALSQRMPEEIKERRP